MGCREPGGDPRRVSGRDAPDKPGVRGLEKLHPEAPAPRRGRRLDVLQRLRGHRVVLGQLHPIGTLSRPLKRITPVRSPGIAVAIQQINPLRLVEQLVGQLNWNMNAAKIPKRPDQLMPAQRTEGLPVVRQRKITKLKRGSKLPTPSRHILDTSALLPCHAIVTP